MLNEFSRTHLLLGEHAMQKLKSCHIAIFGIGGVGSYALEALARSGVGALSLFHHDKVCVTNINRQLIATHKTIGLNKVDAAKQRILEINPKCKVEAYQCFYSLQTADNIDLSVYSYIIDAIDTISSKLLLIERGKKIKYSNNKLYGCRK
jgi:tRNA A37 threonylcarbamoyladenosine dehydratase